MTPPMKYQSLTMSRVWVLLAVFGTALAQQNVDIECALANTNGCKMLRNPSYVIVTSSKIRPLQIVKVFVSVLQLEFHWINIRVSIVRGNMQYASKILNFDRLGSKTAELLLPSNALPGHYHVQALGYLNNEDSGAIFFNETDVEFDTKQASVFIQMNHAFFKQKQTVRFRVIPLLPNLMPKYGVMTILVQDPSGIPVRRWQDQQTNIGGFVEKSFKISAQPKLGDWEVLVRYNNYEYRKQFAVYYHTRGQHEINITVPAIMHSDDDGINGTLYVNHTSDLPLFGNATISMTILRDGQEKATDNSSVITKHINHFANGRIDFFFKKEEILEKENVGTMAKMTFLFKAAVKDWESVVTKTAYSKTKCVESRVILKWVGGKQQTFKAGSIFTAHLAVMNADGTPVTDPSVTITVSPFMTGFRDTILTDQTRQPVDGFITFSVHAPKEASMIRFRARNDLDPFQTVDLHAHRYYSSGSASVKVTTSTKKLRVNDYAIFHIRTSVYVPEINYLIVSKGNILLADSLRMISRQKTFSLAVSRDMVPAAKIVVYYVYSMGEIVVDALNFFVDVSHLNPVEISFNRGKNFAGHEVEFSVKSTPGSFAATSAMQQYLQDIGLNDGLTETMIIEELLTYEGPDKGPHMHKWRLKENEYLLKFFISNSKGFDSLSTFYYAGLKVLTDSRVTQLPNKLRCLEGQQLPCVNGLDCYRPEDKCNGVGDCPDWSDEFECQENDDFMVTSKPQNRMNRLSRYYDSNDWIWKDNWVKPSGQVAFPVKVPSHAILWRVGAFSVSPDKGFGIAKPVEFDATRAMYILVDAAPYAEKDEHIGFRVTVFNYWYGDDYLEVLVTLHASDYYKFVHVDEYGHINSFNARTSSGDHMTLVYLEAGESRDIYMPVLPTKWEGGKVAVTISATSYLARDVVTTTVKLHDTGVTNFWHTPYLIDLITKGSIDIYSIDIPVRETPVIPEQRDLAFIPGTPEVSVMISGDVVMPGLVSSYMTTSNTLSLPDSTCEMSAYNIAYNVLTLKFKKMSHQLTLKELTLTLSQLNIGLQKLLTFMEKDFSFRMFVFDEQISLWATAFAAKTLSDAHVGEWDSRLFIPIDLVSNITLWICAQQHASGAFNPVGPAYNDIFNLKSQGPGTLQRADPIILTSYVLIALKKITHLNDEAKKMRANAAKKAHKFLRTAFDSIKDEDVFQLAIATYAMSLTEFRQTAYSKLMSKKRTGDYWSNEDVPGIPKSIINNVITFGAKDPWRDDAYAIQATSYALLTQLLYGRTSRSLNNVMQWLQTMRLQTGGFVSTQDTIIAMEALMKFVSVDRNRNYFDMSIDVSATSNWSKKLRLTMKNYTTPFVSKLPNPWGYVQMKVVGTGRGLLQVSSYSSHEYPWQLLQPLQPSYNVTLDTTWGGRNYSEGVFTVCARWFYTMRSARSGLSIIYVDIPSGVKVSTGTLRKILKSKKVPSLMWAEYIGQRAVFYIKYLDESSTCITFPVNRWWRVARSNEKHLLMVFDYYNPGLFNMSLYTVVNLVNLDLCYACASFQCPYCPWFNTAGNLYQNVTLSVLSLAFVIFCIKSIIY